MKKSAVLIFALVATAFGALAAAPVKVVSFSTILTEIATTVGGDAVSVAGLVKPGADPHEYEPTPDDLKQLGDAQVILTSGKNIEHYFDKLQSSVGTNAIIVKVGDRVPSLEMKSEENAGVTEDPHWWHSVANVEKATKVIRDALIQADPAGKAAFDANAAAYLAKLAALDLWVKQKVAELPRDKRELVTSHDAFQYFAKRYDFRIYAIEGISTEQEASPRQVDELIRTIKGEGVKAIFLEDTLNPKVSSEITRDTGAKIGGTLYADGLGTGEGGTYEGMMKHNVTTIVEALK